MGTVTMIAEKMKKVKKDEEVEGITIVINDEIKEIFEMIINRSGTYKNYKELLREAMVIGVNEIIKSIPQEQK